MCDVDGCKKNFTAKSSVLMHKRVVHEKVRKYRCEQCGSSFGNSTDLKRHSKVHTGERPYACTECAMKFSEMASLRVHYRYKHTLKQPYSCAIGACEKMFATMDQAEMHKQRVHEKVPVEFRCEQCDHVFTSASNLSTHRRTHTGERPYSCTECAMKFVQKVTLQRHYSRQHASNRPHACDTIFHKKKNRSAPSSI
jgi:KRAB domain-containing zinc finger protein